MNEAATIEREQAITYRSVWPDGRETVTCVRPDGFADELIPQPQANGLFATTRPITRLEEAMTGFQRGQITSA